MNEPTQKPIDTETSWQPFMCPSCRGLFRSPSGKAGEAECPLCEATIQIRQIAEDASENKETNPSPERRRRKKQRQSSKPNEQSWEKEKSRGGASKGIIFTSLFLFSILLCVSAVLFLKERERRLDTFKKGRPLSNENQSKNSPLKGSFFDFSNAASNSPKEPLLEIDPADLETAREAANAFLDCKTIEEFTPLIRDPERVMPLARKFYQQTPYQANGALTVDENGMAQVAKRFASFNIILKDYSSRPIALELTQSGALVDWESWVGYCAIPWETFIEKKLIEPTEVRVRIKQANYYNFNFRDDSKWACFRLMTSTDSTVVYGYALRSEDFFSQLPRADDPEATAILNVHFPAPAVSSNQVVITDFLQSGWVLGL